MRRHALELLDQMMHFGRLGPAARGDPVAAAAVDLVRDSTFVGGHRIDHGFDALEFLLRVDVGIGIQQAAQAGDHPQDLLHRAELCESA